MRRVLFLLLILIIFSRCKKPEFQKEDILVTGTAHPVLSLNGTWKFTMTPPENFQLNITDISDWSNILVPGECAMQGFAIRHNIPYVYKTSVHIPEDFRGKVIKLRFEGVYSYSRVWIDGKFIRDHEGGFTPWECDITDIAIPGSRALITVEFTDRDNDLSYASGYAKHQIGGILRGVSLYAIPENFPKAIYINTEFDKKYKDADLNIRILRGINKEAWVGFRMYDRHGNQVRLNDRRYRLKNDTSLFSFRINSPFQWDAENPNLYTLIVEVFDKSILTASYKTRLGFREVKVDGNKLLVNGHPVKLRGACRHDIHPVLGRVSTPEYDKMDVQLAKEANINFIRTSHYPPSEAFLRYCDEFGIYVEDEAPVCFVNTHRNRFYKELKQSGPEFIGQQLAQVEEMIQNHINHPSVIIWSLGNESLYNEGFKKGYDYIKSTDATRPVIFSYPGTVPDSIKCYDILSLHYPSWNGSVSQWGIKVQGFNYDKMPVIYDEWAHVACYNKPELLEDMNIRNFWGESLDTMWTNLYASDGTGGAIWGFIDETFMLPDTMQGYDKWWGIQEETNGIRMYEGPAVGYGEWGIIDVWRRKKPEFWNTKKAYSPVKITINEIHSFKPGAPLRIPVYNRFSHTNLKDIKALWTYRGKSLTENLKNIPPSGKGEILLFPKDWKQGEIINIKFYKTSSELIDEYNIRLGSRTADIGPADEREVSYRENPEGIINVHTGDIYLQFNMISGLLENVHQRGDTLIKSGPWLHLRYPEKDHWSVMKMKSTSEKLIIRSVKQTTEDGGLKINVSGITGKISLDYILSILPGGIIEISWTADGLPENLRAEELGLAFNLGPDYDSLKWDRKSYWNAYPANHPGSDKGGARLDDYNINIYRSAPSRGWETDNKSFYYNGFMGSRGLSWLAGSMKENIYSYTLSADNNNELTVLSDGRHACRLKENEKDITMYVNSYWDYLSLNWGNYIKNDTLPGKISDTIRIRIK